MAVDLVLKHLSGGNWKLEERRRNLDVSDDILTLDSFKSSRNSLYLKKNGKKKKAPFSLQLKAVT